MGTQWIQTLTNNFIEEISNSGDNLNLHSLNDSNSKFLRTCNYKRFDLADLNINSFTSKFDTLKYTNADYCLYKNNLAKVSH